MGTRNLTKVIDKDNVVRVAQYGQWDGYPEYTGTRILEFISEYRMLDKIEQALSKAEFVSDEYVDSIYSNYNGEYFFIAYPSLARDTGCDILKTLVYSNGTVPLVDSSEFEQDDLFCEGVYTLNYHSRTFTSTYNGVTVSIEFDRLPTAEEYLNSFQKLLTPAV
jgi:hypothetical protein